jgi:hypothetical protein
MIPTQRVVIPENPRAWGGGGSAFLRFCFPDP